MDELKPIFQLTRAQYKQLTAIEYTSFVKHCNRFGWDPKDFEKKAIDNFRQRDTDIIKSIRQRANRDSALELFESNDLFHTDNYWQYLHIQSNIKRRMISDWICKAAPSLPIDYNYVFEIAKLMSLTNVSPQKINSLRTFLLNIPLINIFDLEFNAFVTRATVVDNIPCVCIHTSLPETAEFFANLFLSVLIPEKLTSTKIKLSLDDKLNKKINSREFMWSCISGFRALLGSSTELGITPQYQLTKLHPNLYTEFLNVLDGTSGFVALHEFGHLLMGHLEKSYVPSLETEADSFAAKTLALVEEHRYEVSWTILGLAIIFNILEMIELLTENTSKTHPKAMERLAALQNKMPSFDLCATAATIKLLWIPSYKQLGADFNH